MERIVIATQYGGAGAGARDEADKLSFCLAAEPLCPPVGGLFGFKFSSKPHPWKLA
jgi:hypothetical protein